MTNEEQKEKYREWLFHLANIGDEKYFQSKVKVFEGKNRDGTHYVRAYMGKDNYVIFSPIEWLGMYRMALSVLHSKQFCLARPPKGRGILEQIKRDIPVK